MALKHAAVPLTIVNNHMSKAIILGCSHSAGAEIRLTPGVTFNHPSEEVEFEAQNSYPVLLAKLLGYTPYNHAISGGSNDAMFRIFLEQLETLTEQDIVIACWTGLDRGELWHEKHQYWIPINYDQGASYQREPHDLLLEGKCIGARIDNEELYNSYGKQWLVFEGHGVRGWLNKIKNVVSLNAIAKAKNIKVINNDSFAAVMDPPWSTEINFPTDSTFCNWAIQNKYPHTPGGHFFLEAHQAYAQHLFECITSAVS